MQSITSPSSKRFKDAMQLHRARGRKKQNRIVVFGAREVARAIDAGVVVDELFVRKHDEPSSYYREIESKLDRHVVETKLFELTDKLFDDLAFGDRNCGVIMTAARPSTDLVVLEKNAGGSPAAAEQFVVVCERIEKPGNLGGIIRSADASAAMVLVADVMTDVFHPNSIRNSAGAVFNVPVATASCQEIWDWLSQRGYRILVAMPDAKVCYFETELTGQCAVVLGNEAAGVSPYWRNNNVEPVRIPMLGIADSLNVSVTGALLMYEAHRQSQPT